VGGKKQRHKIHMPGLLFLPFCFEPHMYAVNLAIVKYVSPSSASAADTVLQPPEAFHFL